MATNGKQPTKLKDGFLLAMFIIKFYSWKIKEVRTGFFN